MTDESRVLIDSDSDSGITTLTVNRPKALNALDAATLRALSEALSGAALSTGLRCLILTGAGDKAFVAGADITAMARLTPRQARDFAELGHALGDALEALACDFIYAARTAKFGQPEVNLGVIPGFGGTQRLQRRIGIARARELIYTGEIISAEEGLRIGLVNRIFEPAELMSRARAAAAVIASKAPLAIADAKRAMRHGADIPLAEAHELERQLFAGLFATEDQREGMAAFTEKRAPIFRGR